MRNCLICVIGLLFLTLPLFSHNCSYEVIPPDSISIKTFYDTGEPLGLARVKVFLPDKYEESAYELKTDEQGIFSFLPSEVGLWIFQVIDDSGHGLRINLEITPEMLIRSENSGQMSMVQKIIMGLAVVWGFIGTAFFFLRKKRN